nr:retrovirus-related Pol polyprotein from transposon TNT 1-94 [Tanacetum cinerariifolium]
MANLSEDIQCAGFDTRPPMLDRTDFASWKQRIRLYCRGKENGVKVLQSIDEGPFKMGTVQEPIAEGIEGAPHLSPEHPRVYSDLSPEKRIGHIARNCTQPKHLQNSEYYKDKMLLMQAQENEVALDAEQLLFLAGGQDNAIDDDVDKQPAPTAQTMFIAILSSAEPVTDEAGPSYDLDILSEVQDHDHYQDAICAHHEKHAMHDNVQLNHVVDLHADYTSNSNMISYDQYVKDNAVPVVHSNPALYNGHEIIKDNHVLAIVHNTEDTLEIAEITRRKMNDKMKDPECVTHKVKIAPHDYSKENFLATFTPHKQLTPEQIFWSEDLIKLKSEALKEKHEAIKWKNLLIVNDNLIAECLSKEVFFVATNSEHNVARFTKMHVANTIVEARCLELEAELSNLRDKSHHDNQEELVNHFSKLKVTALTTEYVNLKAQILDKVNSVGLNCCTNADGSQPRRNTKKNKILPAKGVNKLQVEEQPRTNKSYLRTSNHVDSSSRLKRTVVQIVLWYLDSGCSKHMTGDRSRLMNFVKKFIGTVRFRNDHFGAIMGYGDYVIGNSVISRIYYVEGLRHNLFSIRKLYDSNLEVAFRKHSCYVRDTDGVELIKGSRGSNLYTISIEDMMKSSPICMLSKASKNKSWLWHRRLNHLNFGKSKKHTHKPKTENTNLEVLNTLHMDLCGLMCVQTINGKKYILVNVDDYSRFTWVKFLRSKDETSEVVIKFLQQIQVGLNKTVRYIRTDNGTELVNHTLTEYYERIGIFHQKTVPRTPQQNDVVERRNRTLVEVAQTMLIFSKAPMFLWAEAVATACYTQNQSLIHTHHNKTPYELVHNKKPDLTFFRVFGALCYPTNDSEDLGKLQPTADIGIFVGYAPSKKGPAPIFLTPGQISSGLVPNSVYVTPYVPPTNKDLEILFQPMFDEYLKPPLVKRPVSPAQAVQAPVNSAGTPLSTTIDQDAPSPSISPSSSALQSHSLHQGVW